MKKNMNEAARKLMAFELALTVGLTFIPWMGDGARAAEETSGGDPPLRAFEVNADGTETEIDPSIVPDSSEEVLLSEASEEILPMEAEETETAGGSGAGFTELQEADFSDAIVVTDDFIPDGPVRMQVNPQLTGPAKAGGDVMTAQDSENDDTLITQEDGPTIRQDKKTGVVTIQGSLIGDTFYAVAVDDIVAIEPSRLGTSTINARIDMKNLTSVGFHTVYVYTTATFNSTGLPAYYKDFVPTFVYQKPKNKPKMYEVYSKYMYYKSNVSSYAYDEDCGLYMDYKKKGSKAKTYGAMDTYSTYKISRLKGHKKYKINTYYGKYETYQGTDYFFSGKNSGAVSRTQVIITGQPKKPPVKALRRAVSKVRRHKVRYYYYGHYLYTRRYYSYKSTAVIRMKKKPGAAGIIYNGYRLKGNKKTYKKVRGFYTSTKRPRNAKLTRFTSVYLYSYQSKKYGGYSPVFRRK